MYSDTVVGNELSIWSRFHLIVVSLLIFCIGDLPIDKSGIFEIFSYYFSGTCLSCRTDICFIYACLVQCWVHIYLQLLYSVANSFLQLQLLSLSFFFLFAKLLQGNMCLFLRSEFLVVGI